MYKSLKERAKNCCWLNEPGKWEAEDDLMRITTQEKTDFWRQTHYGFNRMNGHVYYEELEGDFETEITLKMEDPSSRYDQAGIFIRMSDDSWLKASLEFIPDGPSHLGAVVTNGGYSDWSTKNFPSAWATSEMSFKVKRVNGDYQIWAKSDADGESGEYEQIRIAHLHEDRQGKPVQVGLYACSPSPDASFTTTFSKWTVYQEV